MDRSLMSSSFWRFSLSFYALPGVEAASIALQDHHRADVNILLFLLFLARAGRTVTHEDLERIEAAVGDWREAVVIPLRGVRRHLRNPPGMIEKEAAANLRAEMKRVELAAERIQQEALEQLFASRATGVSAPSSGDAARANLAAYSARLGGLPEERLAPLLQAFDGSLRTRL